MQLSIWTIAKLPIPYGPALTAHISSQQLLDALMVSFPAHLQDLATDKKLDITEAPAAVDELSALIKRINRLRIRRNLIIHGRMIPESGEVEAKV